MTDKATMPGEVWVSDFIATNKIGVQVCSTRPNKTFSSAQTKYILSADYDSLAAVAQRMHDHLTGRGSTLKDRSDVIDEYNALMKGR